jgi:DNA-binding response OmpR family regulator
MNVPPKKRKIVLLDDSDLVRDLVRETLQEHGYEVVATDTPFGFSNMLRQENPDLALLDVTMPTLRGDKLAEIAINHGVACPIVLFSDRPAAELEVMARAVKAAGYIRKSGDMDEVLRSVQRFLK